MPNIKGLFEINLIMLQLILLIYLHEISVPQGGTFLPEGHNLNKFGTGQRGDAICKI